MQIRDLICRSNISFPWKIEAELWPKSYFGAFWASSYIASNLWSNNFVNLFYCSNHHPPLLHQELCPFKNRGWHIPTFLFSFISDVVCIGLVPTSLCKSHRWSCRQVGRGGESNPLTPSPWPWHCCQLWSRVRVWRVCCKLMSAQRPLLAL